MYGYENYQKVKNEIESRRLAAIAEADARNAEVRLESDEIREIDDELVGTGLLLFKTACEGRDITPIRERNAQLVKKRRKVLKALGYPEDYTEVKYTCPLCSDSGYTGTGMCSCFRELLLKENIRSSGIGNLIEKQSFENFDLTKYEDETVRKRMARNYSVARGFADNFGSTEETKNLLLIGPTGTGKTHISTAIAKTVIDLLTIIIRLPYHQI